MGAMRSPLSPLSLDQRLAQAADIREQIGRQLDEITEALVDLTNIVAQSNSRRDTAIDPSMSSELASLIGPDLIDQMDDSSLDETDMLLQIIFESIKSLLRLGILVRKVSPRDRFQQALCNSYSAFPDWFDINYVTERYGKLRNSQLSKRLGGAIAKRRQVIKYCRDHRSRLGLNEATHDTTDSERISSKATTFVPIAGIQLGNMLEEEDESISLSSASTVADSSSSLKLPQLDTLSNAYEPFECPICFTLQCFQSERAWRIHAFSDLKASHYKCTLCRQGDFSFKSLQSHIATIHGSFSGSQLETLRDAGRETPTSFKAKDCPFCDEWAENLMSKMSLKGRASEPTPEILVNPSRFKRHVATHHEQLAIFSVPRATRGEDESDHGSTATLSPIPTTLSQPQALDDDEIAELDADIDMIGESDKIATVDTDEEMEEYHMPQHQEQVKLGVRQAQAQAGDSNATHAETTITGAFEPYDEDREQISRNSTPERDEADALKNPISRQYDDTERSVVFSWSCCQCGMSGLLLEVDLQCTEFNCQHRPCGKCHISKVSVGRRRKAR
ncbi:hypothetical protein TgHK011_005145 [Trichoderma gracile]|nr:hypothetical protein TgHK011_005145 [Trichoderma gracile]